MCGGRVPEEDRDKRDTDKTFDPSGVFLTYNERIPDSVDVKYYRAGMTKPVYLLRITEGGVFLQGDIDLFIDAFVTTVVGKLPLTGYNGERLDK